MAPSLAIVQLIAFLVRHLSSIDHHLLVFYYNNRTVDEVHHIAQALAGQEQQLHINVDRRRQRIIQPIVETAVLLNFAQIYSRTHPIETTRASRWLYIHLTIDWKRLNSYRKLMLGKLDVMVYRVPLAFIATSLSYRLVGQADCIDEEQLVQSFEWLAFRNRAKKLPAGEYITGDDSITVDSAGVADNEVLPMDNGNANAPVQFVSGFRIGIFKICAERLTSKPLNYGTVLGFVSPESHFRNERPFRFRDHRLSLRFARNEAPYKNAVKLVGVMPDYAVAHVFPRRYELLVPRVVVDTENSSRLAHQVLMQFLVVAALWLKVATTADQQREGWIIAVPLFFDTLSRSLGIAPGHWTGSTASERQLLTVIAVFAVLSGSIFSGFLYDQLVIDAEVQYLYNSLQDVCRAGINISIPIGLAIAHYANPLPNCSIMPYTLTPRTNGAVVVDAMFLPDVDYESRNYMVLKEPFGIIIVLCITGTIFICGRCIAILPGYLNTDHVYLDEPFGRIVQQCVEHGLWQALQSSVEHLLELGRHRTMTPDNLGQGATKQTHFEYWLLAIGLASACVVFAGELLLNFYCKDKKVAGKSLSGD